MRRREFIGLIGGTALWSMVARAQRPTLPVIGFLGSLSPGDAPEWVTGFRLGLAEAGYIEGQNVAIEYRWAEGRYDRMPALAEDLVKNQVAVILAASLPSALAAKATTAATPIVFVMGADPVTLGVVRSLNRPGGNITGVSQFFGALGAKRLELLRELLPVAGKIAILTNPNNPNSEAHLGEVERAARSLMQVTEVFRAASESEIDTEFATLVSRGARAVLVADDPFLGTQGQRLAMLAVRNAIPAIYASRGNVAVGGLISYGSSTTENYRQAGMYVGRVLKGEKPGDMPVLQPTKFDLVINLKTAKALGLAVPPSLLARADEVIE